MYVRPDFQTVRNVQGIRSKPKTFLQAREGNAHCHGHAAVIEQLSPGDFHIGKHIIVQKYSCKSHKGHINLCPDTIYLRIFILTVGILIADCHLSALPGQLFVRHFFPVQGIGDGDADGQFFIEIALIINVIALCGPYLCIALFFGKALLSLDILHIGQFRSVCDGALPGWIVQPVADDDFVHIAGFVREDIYGFLLQDSLLFRGCRRM